MKKPNQISSRRNSSGKSASQAPGRDRARVSLRMPRPLSDEIHAKAKREGITKSQLFERAIRRHLPSDSLPAYERPGWQEVACIDFSGFVTQDKDFGEVLRTEVIIYKLPDGSLRAASNSGDAGEQVIEDVTRERVVRWLWEATLPEEFQRDFRCALTRSATWEAGREMEDTVCATRGLLELLASAVRDGGERLTDRAVDGLEMLAMHHGEILRRRYDDLHAVLSGRSDELAAAREENRVTPNSADQAQAGQR